MALEDLKGVDSNHAMSNKAFYNFGRKLSVENTGASEHKIRRKRRRGLQTALVSLKHSTCSRKLFTWNNYLKLAVPGYDLHFVPSQDLFLLVKSRAESNPDIRRSFDEYVRYCKELYTENKRQTSFEKT
mmetsp:Transcript_5946/g.6827  ORF Transcript_5946/g.6827 Transcript_5946/m.6827 type:complete len:129 (+) Transcript_5946:124-510(+)